MNDNLGENTTKERKDEMAEKKTRCLLLRCLINHWERISGCCCLDEVTCDSLLIPSLNIHRSGSALYTQRDPYANVEVRTTSSPQLYFCEENLQNTNNVIDFWPKKKVIEFEKMIFL